MKKLEIPNNRLTIYRDAIRTMREGNFSIILPESEQTELLGEFEAELIRLAAWLELRFEEYNKLQEITTENRLMTRTDISWEIWCFKWLPRN